MRKIFGRYKELKEVQDKLILENSRLTKKLDEKIHSLEEQVDKLDRIVKYAKDEPTCAFTYDTSSSGWPYSINCKCILYLYINKKEYKIEITDLHIHLEDLITTNAKLINVSGGIATVDIEEGCLVHTFTIDYRKGTYVSTVSNKVKVSESTVSTFESYGDPV